MKIGLIDVDSHNFPNLCLMKLYEYHTRRGDRVEWWSPKGRYDLVYKSRVAEKTSPMRSSTSGRTTFCIRGFWERPTAF